MHVDPTTSPRRYTLFEDVQGILIASVQSALGLHLLRSAGLMTGGSAGMALIISYYFGWNFSLVFFVLNIPFYGFAYIARGLSFAIKSAATVALVSLIAEALNPLLHVDKIHPAAAAVLFGISTGVGLLGLFRHKGSLGGMSILALILQDRYGIKAGKTQFIHDAVLFGFAFCILPLHLVGWSLLGAVIVNLVIMFNHRRDWYVMS